MEQLLAIIPGGTETAETIGIIIGTAVTVVLGFLCKKALTKKGP